MWLAFAVGVGNKPEAVPPVRGAKGACGKTVPLRIEPERGQVPENTSEAPSKQSWDVLHDDVSGSYVADEPCEFGPKTRACPVDPRATAGVGEVLAGEATAEDVDVWHRHGHHPSSNFATRSVGDS
jgi:hypothetical protein